MDLTKPFRKAAGGLSNTLGKLAFSKAEKDSKFEAVSYVPQGGATYSGLASVAGKDFTLAKPSRVTFAMLRQISKVDALTRICITAIKKSVSQSKWRIVPEEGVELTPELKKRIDIFTTLFRTQNDNNENMRLLLDRTLEDLLALDAAVIEKVYDPEGNLVGLNSVDGATIRPVYNIYGNLGDPAYKQYINNDVVANFQKDELLYIMQNPQNDVYNFGYGLSPIESILLMVQASLQADLHNAKAFSEDNIPPGILDLGDISETEVSKFKAVWDATVLKNTHKLKMVGSPEGIKYIPFQNNNKDMQYVEYTDWLSRMKLAAFGLSSIDANILQDVNRSTAESQEAISNSRGVRSIKCLFEEFFTREILNSGEESYLKFIFEEAVSLEDKKKQAEIDKINIESGVITPDEIRDREGLDVLEVSSEEDTPEKSYLNKNKKYYPPVY